MTDPFNGGKVLTSPSYVAGASSSSNANIGPESQVCAGQPRNCPQNAMDGAPSTLWLCDNAAANCSMEFDFGQSELILGVMLQAPSDRLVGFDLESSDDGTTYTHAHTYTNIDANEQTLQEYPFVHPVQSRYWRLSKMASRYSMAPGINEIAFFASNATAAPMISPSPPPPSPFPGPPPLTPNPGTSTYHSTSSEV